MSQANKYDTISELHVEARRQIENARRSGRTLKTESGREITEEDLLRGLWKRADVEVARNKKPTKPPARISIRVTADSLQALKLAAVTRRMTIKQLVLAALRADGIEVEGDPGDGDE